MKQHLRTLTVITLLLALLAGCGKQNAPDLEGTLPMPEDVTDADDGPILSSLAVPQVSVGCTGLVSATVDENTQYVRFVDQVTGEETYYFLNAPARLKPGSDVVGYACGEGFLDSGPSEALTFDAESVTFSATENPLSGATENPDGSRTLIAVSDRGNLYEFRIEGDIAQVPGAWGSFPSGSVLYNVDPMHGIFAQECPEHATDAQQMSWACGYMFPGSGRPTSSEEMDNWAAGSCISSGYTGINAVPSYYAIGDKPSLMVGGGEPVEGEALVLESITLYFNGIETQIQRFGLHDIFRRAVYLPGTPYISQNIDYPLSMYCAHGDLPGFAVDYFLTGDIRFGDLKDAQGNVITDPAGRYLQPGDTLQMHLTDAYSVDVPLVAEALSGAANANEARPFTFSDTTGEMNVIVVPMVWSDQLDRANDQNMEAICRSFGNVLDEKGNVTVYSGQALSLSEYYRIASYDQLTINAFITDWYPFGESFQVMKDQPWGEAYRDVYEWVRQSYPDLDMTRFDNDRDGILDEIVFINTGSYTEGGDMSGFVGSYRYVFSYNGIENDPGGTPEEPAINHYVNLTLGHLFRDHETGGDLDPRVLIHEFGHTIALNDYYDTGSGVLSFLGGYDMQDGTVGDWNAYSKFCAGWLQPTVVEESTLTDGTGEFILRSSALYGDALLIPAAGYDYNGTPYDEYILVDLFTPEGLHAEDSQRCGLQDAVGVRIYHVSDLMELGTSRNRDGSVHTFGIQHFANDSSTFYSQQFGMHQLEILSATGKNMFSQRGFGPEDLFTAGSSFTAEAFPEFFHKGRMDDGSTFGYEIAVKSIELVDGEYVATVTVTRK